MVFHWSLGLKRVLNILNVFFTSPTDPLQFENFTQLQFYGWNVQTPYIFCKIQLYQWLQFFLKCLFYVVLFIHLYLFTFIYFFLLFICFFIFFLYCELRIIYTYNNSYYQVYFNGHLFFVLHWSMKIAYFILFFHSNFWRWGGWQDFFQKR